MVGRCCEWRRRLEAGGRGEKETRIWGSWGSRGRPHGGRLPEVELAQRRRRAGRRGPRCQIAGRRGRRSPRGDRAGSPRGGPPDPGARGWLWSPPASWQLGPARRPPRSRVPPAGAAARGGRAASRAAAAASTPGGGPPAPGLPGGPIQGAPARLPEQRGKGDLCPPPPPSGPPGERRHRSGPASGPHSPLGVPGRISAPRPYPEGRVPGVLCPCALSWASGPGLPGQSEPQILRGGLCFANLSRSARCEATIKSVPPNAATDTCPLQPAKGRAARQQLCPLSLPAAAPSQTLPIRGLPAPAPLLDLATGHRVF